MTEWWKPDRWSRCTFGACTAASVKVYATEGVGPLVWAGRCALHLIKRRYGYPVAAIAREAEQDEAELVLRVLAEDGPVAPPGSHADWSRRFAGVSTRAGRARRSKK